LIVIGGLFIYYIPNVWMKIIFAVLFLYLSCFQMMTIYQHHRTNIWLDIYPVETKPKQQAVMKLLYQLSIGQAVIFSLVFLFTQAYIGFAITLLGGILFNFLFINGYVKAKLV
jgi:ABC-2 type transport system permease protein